MVDVSLVGVPSEGGPQSFGELTTRAYLPPVFAEPSQYHEVVSRLDLVLIMDDDTGEQNRLSATDLAVGVDVEASTIEAVHMVKSSSMGELLMSTLNIWGLLTSLRKRQ